MLGRKPGREGARGCLVRWKWRGQGGPRGAGVKDILSGGNSEDGSPEAGPGRSSFKGVGVVGELGNPWRGCKAV